MENVKIDAVAYHEAGHAFIATMTKKIHVTKVYYDGALEGYTLTRCASGDINFEKLCFYLAGEITEYWFLKNESEAARHSGIDRKIIEDLLFLISENRARQYAIWQKAIHTVEAWLSPPENEKKIQRIAEELMAKGSLSEKEFNAIMEE